MTTDKNIRIEMVKPLVFHVHYNTPKKTFEVINYITDWHCKCSHHINTSKECKHIKIVKSWLGLNKRTFIFKKNDNIAEERFNEVMYKLIELETKLDNLSERKEDHLVVKGKTWDDAKRIFKKFPKEHFPYLFTNKHTGEKIDDKTITRNFKKFCGFNTHAIRYKYATELYKNGYSSKQIAEMLGIQEQTLKHYIQEKQIVQIQNTREIPNLVLI